ncbi:unnamed protein product, partial [Lampetra planeri]
SQSQDYGNFKKILFLGFRVNDGASQRRETRSTALGLGKNARNGKVNVRNEWEFANAEFEVPGVVAIRRSSVGDKAAARELKSAGNFPGTSPFEPSRCTQRAKPRSSRLHQSRAPLARNLVALAGRSPEPSDSRNEFARLAAQDTKRCGTAKRRADCLRAMHLDTSK